MNLEKKYEEKWKIKTFTDDELKTIAKDIYNGDIFTDRHCSDENISLIFMPLIFINSRGDSDKRDSKIYDIVEREIEDKYFNEYVSNIGLVYEYLSKRGPVAINGNPIFYSCSFLSKYDTTKMFEYYDKYKELRESIDNF